MRRTAVCGVAVTVLLASVMAMPAVGGETAVRVERSTPVGLDIAPGPDGRLWEANGLKVGWLDDAGGLTTAEGTGETPTTSGPLTPLADGSIAQVATLGSYPDIRLVVVRLRAGFPPDVTASARVRYSAAEAALQSDGSVVLDDICNGRVLRISPAGFRYVARLRSRACTSEEGGSAIAVGEDGTTWVVHACQGRIVRVPLVGRVREWSAKMDEYCVPDSPHYSAPPLYVAPTPEGGLRMSGATVSAKGKLSLAQRGQTLAVTPDGSRWTTANGGLTQRAPDGTVRRWPWVPVAATAGPDGDFWYLRAQFERTVEAQPYFWTGWNVRVGTIDPSGTVNEQPLAPYGPARAGSPVLTRPPHMVPGPRNGVSFTELRDDGGVVSAHLVRLISTRRLEPAPPTRADVVRVLGQRRGVLWLQLRCLGRPGQYCAGTIRLRSARFEVVRHAARFSFPVGEARPVRLGLTALSRRWLHANESLSTRAVLRIAGEGGDSFIARRPLRIASRASTGGWMKVG
jgi:hypothetical protein